MKYLIILIIALVSCKSAEQKRIETLQTQYTANLISMEVYYQKSKREHRKADICRSDTVLRLKHLNIALDYIYQADSLKDLNEEISLELLRLREL